MALTDTDRRQILHMVDAGVKAVDIAAKFNVSESVISRTKAKRLEIEMRLQKGEVASSSKRFRKAKFEEIDIAMLQWFSNMRTTRPDAPILPGIITEKAKEMADALGVEGFDASRGWLQKWQTRHNIVLKPTHGEAASVDQAVVDAWRAQDLPAILAQFKPDDVFNDDETGLFWKLLPKATCDFKGRKCSGGKANKQRVTVVIGANMSGTEKLPLIVIGKSKKPSVVVHDTVVL